MIAFTLAGNFVFLWVSIAFMASSSLLGFLSSGPQNYFLKIKYKVASKICSENFTVAKNSSSIAWFSSVLLPAPKISSFVAWLLLPNRVLTHFACMSVLQPPLVAEHGACDQYFRLI